jgi:hypothetical protein
MLQQLISTMGQIKSLDVALTAGKKMSENWDKMVCFAVL